MKIPISFSLFFRLTKSKQNKMRLLASKVNIFFYVEKKKIKKKQTPYGQHIYLSILLISTVKCLRFQRRMRQLREKKKASDSLRLNKR